MWRWDGMETRPSIAGDRLIVEIVVSGTVYLFGCRTLLGGDTRGRLIMRDVFHARAETPGMGLPEGPYSTP